MSALLGIAMDINERIRSIQRRERVHMIATRVRAVPPGMNIVKDGREFVMDDPLFREREMDDRGHSKGRAGKTLPLADFVCLPSSFPPLSFLSLSLFLTSLLSLSLSRSLSLSLSLSLALRVQTPVFVQRRSSSLQARRRYSGQIVQGK
jgi:hypothetical protein